VPIRHKEYDIAKSCHCEGVKPEAMTANITRVTKIMANRYGSGFVVCWNLLTERNSLQLP
jgi:hypothetical protein